MIKVSIIIPVYNSSKYIKRCLNSIVNQTFKDFEVIIINDGSKDNTVDIINEYNHDKRIKLINRNNKGIGSARNLGIEKSIGKYICFIDSDDYVENDYLEVLYNKITKDNLDLVVCNYNEINEELDKKRDIIINEFSNTTLEKEPKLLLSVNKSPWNKIYKKSIINNIKFPVDLKYEDTEFLCKVLLHSKVGYVNNKLYNYVIHKCSETTTMDEKVFDIIKIVDNIRNYYKNCNDDILKYLDMMTLQILTTYTIQQRYQNDKVLRKKFINEVFDYLKLNIPDYKENKYFKTRGLKGIIEKNKLLNKLFVRAVF